MLSESEKVYHVRSKTPNDIQANIVGINAITNEEYLDNIQRLPDLISAPENESREEVDLTNYILRQKTQEYLYYARNITVNIENISNTMISLPKHTKKELSKKIENMRQEIKSFLKFIKNYMKTNYLQSNKFYTTLYEDMCIAYKTFGTEKGVMYSGSRQCSQGQQTSYTVSSSNLYDETEMDDTDTDIDLYLDEKPQQSPYSRKCNNIPNLSVNTTPKQMKMMSQCVNSRSPSPQLKGMQHCVNSRSPSPPLISKKSISLEDFKPLTELDNVILFNRRNVIS